MVGVPAQTCPVLTGRAGGLPDEGPTRIHRRSLDLPDRAPVSLGCRFAVSRTCFRRRARSGGDLSAPVLEFIPIRIPRRAAPVASKGRIASSYVAYHALAEASATPAASELWHTFLCAGPVVLRQRVLRIGYILLCQQRLLQKWPSLPKNFRHPLLHRVLSGVGPRPVTTRLPSGIPRSALLHLAVRGDVERGSGRSKMKEVRQNETARLYRGMLAPQVN